MTPGARSRGALLLSRLGKTQAGIASKCSVSTGVVAMWMSGQRTPGLANRKLLQQKFKIPIESWDEVPERKHEPTRAPSSPTPAWGDGAALSRVERLQSIVDSALAELEHPAGAKEPDGAMTPLERAKVMADLARTLGAIRRLKGEEVSEVKVLRHPKWQAIRDAILDVLKDEPKLLARVVARLEDDDQRQAG